MEKLRSVLVTDRTQADVNARNAKGTYNAADLNRVLRACAWLAGKLARHGYSVPGEYFPAVLAYAKAEPPGGGTVKSALCYEGETAVVEAVPAGEFRFTGWTENGETVSLERVYSFPAERDRDLTAVFRAPEDARLGIVGVGRVGAAQVMKGV